MKDKIFCYKNYGNNITYGKARRDGKTNWIVRWIDITGTYEKLYRKSKFKDLEAFAKYLKFN